MTTSGPTRRRQPRASATREALLNAALQEFAAHGFTGASTRAIAARAGTHQPQINYHFESKDALWRAAVDHVFERLDALLAEHELPAPRPRSLRAAFAAHVGAFVHAAAALPELNRIMVQEATSDSDRLAWIVDRHVRARFEAITSAWSELRARGDVPDIDPTIVYYSIVGAASLVYVNAPEARRLGRDPLTPAFADAHAAALVLMLLGPEPTPTSNPRQGAT
jgi:AcrR family transcriptional regulator